jgi:N-acetylmuramoyl-L-alanine amidase
MPEYKVKQGDCISSIAERHGLFWEKVWDHPKNSRLKEQRKDPNILYPGDILFIPEKEKKEESGATEQKHRFRKKGTPAKLRLIIERDDKPIKNTDYILTIDGEISRGETDEKGLIEVPIKPNTKHGRLEIADLVYELDFGFMDPIDENTGVQTRLQNLGFYHGALDGIIGPRTAQAIGEFQAFSGLKLTGTLDNQTRDKLFERQDKEHEAPPDENHQEDSPGPTASGEVDNPDDISDSIEEVDDNESAKVEMSAPVSIDMPDDISDR